MVEPGTDPGFTVGGALDHGRCCWAKAPSYDFAKISKKLPNGTYGIQFGNALESARSLAPRSNEAC